MAKIEKIGKVVLDYENYSGKDEYSDGPIEDKLLSIVKNHKRSEFTSIIEKEAEWPLLYHLSYLRQNTVEWLPIKSTDKVLEIGSGPGAITRALAKKCKELTCVELSEKRSLINAHRNKDLDNVTIKLGNFIDVEKTLEDDYDYILLIGVFEYAVSYMGTDTPYEDFLNIMKKHLAKDGHMVIAIENKIGLKYWAGCREDHLGTFFSGIEGYEADSYVRTFSKPGLEKLFHTVNMDQYTFYYPYPDYKFMGSLYSDDYLPSPGDLSQNLRNFDRSRMQLFDEEKTFSSIIGDGLFDQFSNSFMVIIGEPLHVKYVKYANERDERFRISTRIMGTDEDDLYVEKVPLTKSAEQHIEQIKQSYDKLVERYQGGELNWNLCERSENGIFFEFLRGETLEEKLDQCLLSDDFEGFYELLEEYRKRIEYNAEVPVCDYDLIFSNIIIHENSWTVIDYEWTFEKITPVAELLYRACYYYASTGGIRKKLKLNLIKEFIGITDQEAEKIIEEDQEFQEYVLGKQMLLGKLRDKIGNEVIHPIRLINCASDTGDTNRVQVYYDYGQGANEEESFFVAEAFRTMSDVSVTVSVPEGVKYLRVDPLMDSCMVEVVSTTWNDDLVSFDGRGKCITNGVEVERGIYAFETKDPNINFDVSGLDWKKENVFHVDLRVNRMNPEMAGRFKKRSFIERLRR